MLNSGSFCKKPEEFDVYAEKGFEQSVGIFFVIIKHPESGELVSFPLRFLGEKDFDYKKSIHKISSSPAPASITPVGVLEHKFVLRLH